MSLANAMIDPGEHVRLAHSLAAKYGRTAPDPEGVVEVAALSLLRAATAFDPSRGAWSAYASASVAAAVRGDVLRQFREPRAEPLIFVGEDGTEEERRDFPHVDPHDGSGLMVARLEEVLGELRPRDREVLARRFGLEGEEQTYDEIAVALGICRSTVRSVEARALAKLRAKLRRRTREVRHALRSS